MSNTDADPLNGFQAIHAAHEAEIYAFILDRVKNQEDAEDLTVEVFVAAYRSWSKFKIDPPTPVAEWLQSIAAACCQNRGRKIGPPPASGCPEV